MACNYCCVVRLKDMAEAVLAEPDDYPEDELEVWTQMSSKYDQDLAQNKLTECTCAHEDVDGDPHTAICTSPVT